MEATPRRRAPVLEEEVLERVAGQAELGEDGESDRVGVTRAPGEQGLGIGGRSGEFDGQRARRRGRNHGRRADRPISRDPGRGAPNLTPAGQGLVTPSRVTPLDVTNVLSRPGWSTRRPVSGGRGRSPAWPRQSPPCGRSRCCARRVGGGLLGAPRACGGPAPGVVEDPLCSRPPSRASAQGSHRATRPRPYAIARPPSPDELGGPLPEMISPVIDSRLAISMGYELREGVHAGHIGDQTPLALHDRPPRVRRGEPEIRASAS